MDCNNFHMYIYIYIYGFKQVFQFFVKWVLPAFDPMLSAFYSPIQDSHGLLFGLSKDSSLSCVQGVALQ